MSPHIISRRLTVLEECKSGSEILGTVAWRLSGYRGCRTAGQEDRTEATNTEAVYGGPPPPMSDSIRTS